MGYAIIGGDVIGLNIFIKWEAGYHYITLNDNSGNEIRIRLKRLIVRQKAVVCWGTTYFKTQNNYIVKFSWALDK